MYQMSKSHNYIYTSLNGFVTFENIQPIFFIKYEITYIFSHKMLTFLSYIKHLITGICIIEDAKMSSLHFKKMHRQHNILLNLLVITSWILY